MRKTPRIPAVYWAVILPVFLIGGVTMLTALTATYAMAAGVALTSVPRTIVFSIGMHALPPWIPLSLMLANCVFFFVPSLQKLAEKYMAEAGRPGFKESQKSLGIATAILAAWSALLIIV